jgi:amino acid adenylation domain-containing protein
MNDASKKLAQLSPEAKRALLAQLLRQKVQESKEELPLSQGQRALWFLYRLAPESAAYNLLYAARVYAAIDTAALGRALQTLLGRYPLLTATFAMEGKEPVQRLHKDLVVPIEVVDAAAWSEDVLRQQVEAEGNRPFNLETGPLLRLHIYQRSAQESILALTIHHIAIDLWSLDQLIDELSLLYAGEVSGMRAPLPPVAMQYSDFVRWQREMLAGAQGERHLHYWQQQLTGELPMLSLPTDKPRPPVQTYRGASYSFAFSEELCQQLRQLAQAEQVTLYTLMVAAFEVLLFRYSEQEDILIGTPTLGRSRAELAKVIGYFANPVVLRANFSANPSFKEVLKRARQNVIDALDHQDYPFPLLVEKLQPRRDPSYSPLIQALFIWDKPRNSGEQPVKHVEQNGAGTPGQLAQAIPHLEPFVIGQQGAPFDLTLTIFELERSLAADFRYNVDLFEEATMARMAQHFQTLLTSILAQPAQRVLDLPLLSEAERRTMLVEWNRTQRPYPDTSTIHQLFEQQVARTPEATAVIFAEQRLSYRELNVRANRVAHALQASGVGPDVLVGVCMERSIAMVVALYAILKAGGAYVPLEPTYPRERLVYMIQDAQLPLVLTQEQFRELVPEGVQVLCLDDEQYMATLQDEENPVSTVGPEHLMYMIYTSGSTGKPKGVMNIHRALVNRLHWMQQEYQLTAQDCVMQKTPFSFDVSVWEFFWPLLYGARLVVARPGGHQDPSYLAWLIEGQQVTTLHFVPSMLHVFLAEPQLERCTSLKRVICSGEAMTPELQDRFFARFANAELHNLYGPTEAAIDVTYWQCQRDSCTNIVPIGRPIANTQLYILNRAMQPVPVGVAGELHIGGVGLARGYYRRPELTEERFIPDPFSSTPGARLFKTGDLARYRPDGEIEFLGRLDFQVKIRGVRIELGEIEAVLAQHPAIQEAVVVARADGSSMKRLVAYLVLTEEYANWHLPVEALRTFLKAKLPQDMLPSSFVFLDALPLNANGKVDRSALPAPDTTRPELEAAFEAPRTELEKQLAATWSEVLNIERIGIHDNFFDLGGASIECLQVVSKAGELGIQLSPEMLFEHQTIAALASAIEARSVKQTEADAPPAMQAAEARPQIDDVPTIRTDLSRPQEVQPNPGHTIIESIGVYLPPKIVSTKQILEECSTPIRFPFEQMTGIKTRRMAGETEFAFDLARKAVERCLASSKYGPQDIDMLVCSSISRYNAAGFHVTFEPSTAVQLQRYFGMSNALVFDISNACTGMFTGMYILDAFLRAGLIRRGIVVSGEYITHLTKTAQREIESYMDSRMACLTVGDAGAAVLLESSPDTRIGFHEFEMFTLGRFYDLCIAKVSDKVPNEAIMYTDAVKVSAVNIQHTIAHAAHVIERSGWPDSAFQHIIMHQTSKMTIYDAAREINKHFGKELCNERNVINNIAERGNTATTTHIVALLDSILAQRVQSGNNAVFGITGSGVNIGTAIYTFDDLPDRLRRAAQGTWRPEKVASEPFTPLLPPAQHTRRIRVESVGTLPRSSRVARSNLEMVRVAAEQCFANSAYQRNDIDLLLYAGVYRDDFLCEPSIASMVAGTLHINDIIESPQDAKTFSFDVFNGAIGFLNACYTAIGMIQGKRANRALVVTSEVENNRKLFPEQLRGIEETGSCLILDAGPDSTTGFGNFVFRSFTDYIGALSTHTALRDGKAYLSIEQDERLHRYYQQCIAETVAELLRIEQLDMARIKVLLPPQISTSFIAGLSDTLKVSRDRFVDTCTEHDLFSSSIPYALQYLRSRHLVQPGDIGLVIAVGAGIQVGCATYYF